MAPFECSQIRQCGMIRTVQIAVIAFWLVMTLLLVRDTWFPDESRFVQAEVEEVLEAMMVNWHESADMVIVDSDRKIGQLTVSAGSVRETSRPPSTGRVLAEVSGYQLSSTGSLSEFGVELDLPVDRVGPVSYRRDHALWRGSLRFDLDYQVEAIDLELRFPQPGMLVALSYTTTDQQLSAGVTLAGLPVYQFQGPASELGEQVSGALENGLPTISGGVSPMPLPLPLAMPAGDVAAMLPDLETLTAERPTLRATFGRTRILNQSMAVYLLTVATASGETIARLYIGEDGRPVKIDTPFDIEAIAEVLAPEAWLTEPAGEAASGDVNSEDP
jgi:hypothetical protein